MSSLPPRRRRCGSSDVCTPWTGHDHFVGVRSLKPAPTTQSMGWWWYGVLVVCGRGPGGCSNPHCERCRGKVAHHYSWPVTPNVAIASWWCCRALTITDWSWTSHRTRTCNPWPPTRKSRLCKTATSRAPWADACPMSYSTSPAIGLTLLRAESIVEHENSNETKMSS